MPYPVFIDYLKMIPTLPIMHLGVLPPHFNAATAAELESLVPLLDEHGLSAICAPDGIHEWSDEDCVEYGEKARSLGLVVGEVGMWENLMHHDRAVQQGNIERMRTLLRKADLLGCRNAVSLVGSRDSEGRTMMPAAENFTPEFESEFREVVLRVVDGLSLETTHYLIETWPNTFYYEPGSMKAFVDSVGHPRVGLHLDPCNLHHHQWVYRSTERLEQIFAEIGPLCRSVHLKDITWDGSHYQWLMHLDECRIGEGEMDYPTLLRLIDRTMPEDITCYCEHLSSEADYIHNIRVLHETAESVGVVFKKRANA